MNFLKAKVVAEADAAVTLEVAALGRVDLPRERLPGGIVPGNLDTVGVRPEMLTILFEDIATPQFRTEGTVTDTQYYGDMTYYSVKLDGEEAPVTISMRNTAGRSVVTPGSRVKVGWGADSVVVFAE
jgi:spermidine/putrescine transport system ATP-binding protein